MASDLIERPRTEPPSAPARAPLPRAWTTSLGLVSLAAAAIHFAVTGDHFEVHALHGLFFVATAWAQALWAVFMFVAPSRALLVAGLAGNLLVIGTWVVSRTVGVPIGPEPWTPEAIGFIDLLATAFELAIVVGCGVLLVVRDIRPERSSLTGMPGLAAVLSLALLTSAGIASGGDHAHSGAADHPHAEGEAGAGAHRHALVGGSGRPDLFQLATIRNAMERYRDVEVAYADGWVKEHADYAEIGSHFVRESDWDRSGPARPELELTDPEFLMYSKRLTGEWKLIAVAYVVDQALFPEPPTNLKGAQYHEHVWNCIVDGEELEEEDFGVISEEECAEMNGKWSPGGVWMTHVWLVNNPYGIFSEINPLLV